MLSRAESLRLKRKWHVLLGRITQSLKIVEFVYWPEKKLEKMWC